MMFAIQSCMIAFNVHYVSIWRRIGFGAIGLSSKNLTLTSLVPPMFWIPSQLEAVYRCYSFCIFVTDFEKDGNYYHQTAFSYYDSSPEDVCC